MVNSYNIYSLLFSVIWNLDGPFLIKNEASQKNQIFFFYIHLKFFPLFFPLSFPHYVHSHAQTKHHSVVCFIYLQYDSAMVIGRNSVVFTLIVYKLLLGPSRISSSLALSLSLTPWTTIKIRMDHGADDPELIWRLSARMHGATRRA